MGLSKFKSTTVSFRSSGRRSFPPMGFGRIERWILGLRDETPLIPLTCLSASNFWKCSPRHHKNPKTNADKQPPGGASPPATYGGAGAGAVGQVVVAGSVGKVMVSGTRWIRV